MNFNGENFPDEFTGLIPDKADIEAEELFAEADKLLNEGIVSEAVDKLTTILKRNPRFGKAYNHLGWVFETKYNNSERAEQYYKAAMQYAPDYRGGFVNYAYLLSSQQRFEELVAHLEKASQVSGVSKEIIAGEYAEMYEIQGEFEKAKEAYRKAAILTLDNAKLDTYRDSIERCQKKLLLLNPTESFLPGSFQ